MCLANCAQNNSVNNILNRIDSWNDQNSLFKKVAGSRLTNLLITAPTELTTVACSILKTPVLAASSIVKTINKPLVLFGSKAAKNLEDKLPGLTALLRTIAKIVAQTLGTALSMTVGLISPNANFKLHCALGLASNRRQEAIKAALAEKEAEKKRQQELAAKLEAEKVAQENQLLKEQAAVNTLTEAFAVAEKIEEEIANTAETIINTVNETINDISSEIDETVNASMNEIDETLDKIQDSIEEFGEEFETEEDGEEEIEFENPYEFVFEKQYEESYIENALNSAVDRSKEAVKNVVSSITTPITSSTNKAYNYVSGLFADKS